MLPNFSVKQVEKALNDAGNIPGAIKQLIYPGSPIIKKKPEEKNIVISVHSDCGETVINAVKFAVSSLRHKHTLSVSDLAPQFTVSVSFKGTPCKPMIYIEPEPLDAQFCENIEEKSIIITDKYSNIDLNVQASIHNLILLPLTNATVQCAVKKVLAENGIIGEGFGVKKYGDLWHDMLCEIPGVNKIYADAIAERVPTPYEMANHPPDSIETKSGNKIPKRTLTVIQKFYTADDPSTPLDPSKR